MYYLVFILVKLFSLLPFWILYLLSDFTYLIVYYIAGYRKKVVRDNLLKSFPEKTPKERKEIEQKFYHHFCDLFFESLKLMSISKDEILRRMKFIDYEPLLKHYDEGRSVMMMPSHYGNWEWASTFSLLLPEDKPMVQVYKKLSSKISDRLVYILRCRFGSKNIEMRDFYKTLLNLKAGGKLAMFGMISDQSPSRNNIKYRTQFLNQYTPVINGTEQIACKFDYPVYYGQIKKIKRGYYNLTLIPIALQPKNTRQNEITEKYIRMLEKDIIAEPAYWLWSHKRWKHVNKSNPTL